MVDKKHKYGNLHKSHNSVLWKTEKEAKRIDSGVLENYNKQNESVFNKGYIGGYHGSEIDFLGY